MISHLLKNSLVGSVLRRMMMTQRSVPRKEFTSWLREAELHKWPVEDRTPLNRFCYPKANYIRSERRREYDYSLVTMEVSGHKHTMELRWVAPSLEWECDRAFTSDLEAYLWVGVRGLQVEPTALAWTKVVESRCSSDMLAGFYDNRMLNAMEDDFLTSFFASRQSLAMSGAIGMVVAPR